MEKTYAFAAKQVALWAGLLCFIVFLFMIYPILQTPNLGETTFVCGNASLPTFGGEEAKNGKILFIANCAQCHAKNMKDRLTGPPLGGWRNYFKDEKQVYLYLQNPKIYRKSTKNKALKAVLKEYDPTECMAFPSFSEQEVVSIFKYVDVNYR